MLGYRYDDTFQLSKLYNRRLKITFIWLKIVFSCVHRYARNKWMISKKKWIDLKRILAFNFEVIRINTILHIENNFKYVFSQIITTLMRIIIIN